MINTFPNMKPILKRSYKAKCEICNEQGISVNLVSRKGSLCGNCKDKIKNKIAGKIILYRYKKYKNRKIKIE